MPKLEVIDEDRLNDDLLYRYEYLTKFVNFTSNDVALIHGSAKFLGPRVDALVDKVYNKLWEFSCTKQVFFRERNKYDNSNSLNSSLDEYSQSAPQIGMRKSTLKAFIVRLVTKPFDAKMVEEFDRMGRIHTTLGGRTSINVPLIHMNALLGFLQDAIILELFQLRVGKGFNLEGTVSAFAKAITILGDFISRWYEDPRSRGGSTSNSNVVALGAASLAVGAASYIYMRSKGIFG